MKWINTYEPGLLVLSNNTTGEVIRCPLDNEDHRLARWFQWCPHFATGTKSYYIESLLRCRDGKQRVQRLHRLVLWLKDDEGWVDHMNHDTTDNRKANLKVVDRRGNACNQKNNSSGFPGVCFHKATGKWRAEINYQGSKSHLGLFDTKEEAALYLHRFVTAVLDWKHVPYKYP